MKLVFKDIEPFSINKAYYKGSFSRTRELREWATRVISQLGSPVNQVVINHWKKKYKGKHLSVYLKHYIPKSKFYNKDGTISIRSNDLTNIEKLIVDLIFGVKHSLYGLDIDDKNIVQLLSEKIPSKTYSIECVIRSVKLKEVI